MLRCKTPPRRLQRVFAFGGTSAEQRVSRRSGGGSVAPGAGAGASQQSAERRRAAQRSSDAICSAPAAHVGVGCSGRCW